MRTIQEIREASASLGAFLNGHFDAVERITAQTDPEEGRYLDRLPPKERKHPMRGRKATTWGAGCCKAKRVRPASTSRGSR